MPAESQETARPEDARQSRRLPFRAEQLLGILVRRRGANRYAWPPQKWLAAEMGITERQVRYWIAYLIASGHIELEKTNRTNRYWIPPRRKEASSPKRKETSSPERKESSAIEAASDIDLDSAASSAGAAAAELVENENTIQALEGFGMPSIVRAIAESNPSLAAAMLLHLRFRLSACGLEPIRNPPGYIVRCFRDPELCGFMQDDDGQWQPPPGQPRRTRHQGGKEHPRLEEESRRIREFWALSSETISRIETFVREEAPVFAKCGHSSGRVEDLHFRSACIAVMVQWRQEGRLPPAEPNQRAP